MNWGFDLLLEHTEDGYRATVQDSPAGQAVRAFDLPFRPREQHAAVQRLLAEAGDDERERDAQFALARELGGRLFDTIFAGPILALWQESWRRAYEAR
ncbi:MAG: hypothetical protein KDD75_13210, partial [Caldilineaceae bacterium]|nr:hypothetical protein [Caldilineaceae bacterium]